MKIGDKVICVDDSGCQCGKCGGMPVPLVKNNLYVIESMYVHTDGILRLVLIGVGHVDTLIHRGSRGYSAERFRLLDHLKELNARKQELARTI